MPNGRKVDGLVATLRKRLWHLRHGGVKQLQEFERRHGVLRSAKGFDFFNNWNARRKVTSDFASQIPEWQVPDVDTWRARRAITVGVIADPFTSLALCYEWHQVDLLPETWEEQLQQTPISLLFVESAWRGNDDAWKFHLTGPSAPSSALRSLVHACKEQGIPTVFWNKEDPVHYEDFIDTARLFDYVFTTDGAMIEHYRERLGHDRVELLPFAAQPAIHNPMRVPSLKRGELRDVAFAGTFFAHKYPERRDQMDILLGGALAAEPWLDSELDIYSRFVELSDKHAFPAPYDAKVRGELNYRQMLTANRAYKTFLNVNSVTTSASMCARRVFEVTACGTPVLSVHHPALDAYFPASEMPRVANGEEAKRWVRALANSEELRARMTHLAMRRIWRDHTFAHRVNQVLATTRLNEPPVTLPSVTAMISTYRPQQVRHVLEQMARQECVTPEVIVLTHGFEADQDVQSAAQELGLDVQWMSAGRELSLGDCYNMIVAAASSECIAKIDDDDLYGPYYLFDQLSALRYSNAELVGKGAHYVYLEDKEALCLRFEESERSFANFVAGPTIVTYRDLLLNTPFVKETRGEDSQLLRSIIDNGGRVYSSDRFGFVQIRNNPTQHTWRIDDSDILSSSRVITYGGRYTHAIF